MQMQMIFMFLEIQLFDFGNVLQKFQNISKGVCANPLFSFPKLSRS